jgi:outer membrane protein TolC
LSAQSPYKLSVTELVERGIQNSLTIKSAKEKVRISEDKKNIGLKNRLPDIGLNGSVGYVGKSTILDADLSFLSHPKSPS